MGNIMGIEISGQEDSHIKQAQKKLYQPKLKGITQ